MLRKFALRKSPSFLAVSASNNKDEHEEQEKEIFLGMSQQFHELEERLQKVIHLFTRHCNALTEVSQTSWELQTLLPKLYPLYQETLNEMQNEAVAKVGVDEHVKKFRQEVIAPLQTIQAGFPKLKLRMDHRQGAYETCQRYQQKVEDLSSHRFEKARLQRNRIKLAATKKRYRELSLEVHNEMEAVLSRELEAIFSSPYAKLIDTQQVWVKELMACTQHMRERMEKAQKIGVQRAPSSEQPESTKGDAEEDFLDLPREDKAGTSDRVIESLLSPDEHSSDLSTFGLSGGIKETPLPEYLSSNQVNPVNPSRSRGDSISSGDRTSKADRLDTNAYLNDHVAKTFAALSPTSTLRLDKRRTFRPKKKHTLGTRTWQLHQKMKASLSYEEEGSDASLSSSSSTRGCFDFQGCIDLPEGFALSEWISVHVLDFYNEISLLYGTISELCTAESCPKMTAGPCYTYLWADGEDVKTPMAVPAPVYVNYLMRWVERQINDSELFFHLHEGERDEKDFQARPDKTEEFMQGSKKILKRLFRVYGHLYHSHWKHFCSLKAETHLNFCFQRFLFFTLKYQLIPMKELNALRKLIQNILHSKEVGVDGEKPVDALNAIAV